MQNKNRYRDRSLGREVSVKSQLSRDIVPDFNNIDFAWSAVKLRGSSAEYE
jgi:hypothetical protein